MTPPDLHLMEERVVFVVPALVVHWIDLQLKRRRKRDDGSMRCMNISLISDVESGPPGCRAWLLSIEDFQGPVQRGRDWRLKRSAMSRNCRHIRFLCTLHHLASVDISPNKLKSSNCMIKSWLIQDVDRTSYCTGTMPRTK